MFRKFLKVFLFILLFLFAFSLIFIGFYFLKISKKQVIFGSAVDQIFDKAERIVSLDERYMFDDQFEIKGDVKLQLSSEEYAQKGVLDLDYKKKNQMLNNLSKMDISYLMQHDKKNKKAFFELEEKIGEEEIFAGKYYIENSTQYFFVNSILSNYVNDGSNNYFESYTEDLTTSDNLSYLFTFIRDSIKQNVSEDELKGYDVKTLIGDGNTSVYQVSYRITDKSYKSLLKNVLHDLKKDARASQILSLIYPDIKELKVNEKKKYLLKNESYIINLYVSKPLYKPLKYEVVYLKGDQKKIYTYEGDIDDGIFYYSLNNELKYRAIYHSTPKKLDVVLYNEYSKELGTIKGDKDKDNMMVTATLDLNPYKVDFTFVSKNKDFKKNSYYREDSLKFKIMKKMVVQMQGEVEIHSNVSKTVKLSEDVSSSILRSSITEEEDGQLKLLKDHIRERLEK